MSPSTPDPPVPSRRRLLAGGGGSLYERFNTPGIKTSSHFWVFRDGETEQYVSVLDRAWAQVEGNGSWASVETSGFATRSLTEAQVDAVARI